MQVKKPGVADNKSYKDTYHFNDSFYGANTSKDLPSINVDPKINDSIRENPFRSNVEIEGDELVLKPDLSALFKARGKKHSKGGMDVMLEPDSFVFSDDKSLSFNEEDHKLFEFKKGGTFDPKKNTPADVLKRNVDAKHYNTLISNITDIKKDDLAKKSSVMMLEKYIGTLGQIAYLQEQKKNFPTGLPSFSANTAPVYQDDVKNNVMSQKQYAKYGGQIGNPYKMVEGGAMEETDDCVCGRNPITGMCYSPCSEAEIDRFRLTTKDPISTVNKASKDYNYMGVGSDKLANYTKTLVSGIGQTPGKKADYATWSKFVNSEEGKSTAWKRKSYQDLHQRLATSPEDLVLPKTLPLYDEPKVFSKPSTNPVEGAVEKGRDINWEFSKYQKQSQGYNLFKAASAKRYMPYRSHMNPSYMDASLINPEQAVADMQGSTNQQIGALSSLSPILRNAQASSFNGQLMDRVAGIRSQYDNQNSQIINQNRAVNNQISNNARSTNMQNDQNYYRESIIGQQNYDNLKTFLGDQYMNNRNQDIQDNQSLAYNLATLDNPAYGYDFRSGDFYRNKKSVLDAKSNGKGDMLNNYISKMMEDFDSLDPTQRINLLKVMTAKGFNPTGKKGGKMGHNPYK